MAGTVINNRLIVKNTILLYMRMILLMLINLYTSRIVLQLLGVEDYGVYNVVGGVVALWAFISNPMMASCQRFLTFYMGRYDRKSIANVFLTSILIYFSFAIILTLLAETLGLWFASTQLVIPEERFYAAFWTYHCAVASFVFSFLSNPYKALIIAHEDMGAFAYISILDAFLKLMVVFMLCSGDYDRMVSYAVLILVQNILITIIHIIYCKVKYAEARVKKINYSSRLFKDILSFSGWNLMGGLAHVGFLQGTNILLNIFFGPTVNAAKSISMQVSNAVGAFCSNFQVAFSPQIVGSFSANQIVEMHKLVFRSSRFSYFLVLLFSVPVFMRAESLLNIWLVNPPSYAAIFVRYTVIFLLIQSLAAPLITSSRATGDVRQVMGVIALINVMIIPLGYIAFYFGAPPVAIFQIQLLIHVTAHVLRVIIVSKQIHFSKMVYLKTVIIPLMHVSVICFVFGWFERYLPNDNQTTILYSIAMILITGFVITGLGINSHERTILLQMIRK